MATIGKEDLNAQSGAFSVAGKDHEPFSQISVAATSSLLASGDREADDLSASDVDEQ
jgi:hypothetical protein